VGRVAVWELRVGGIARGEAEGWVWLRCMASCCVVAGSGCGSVGAVWSGVVWEFAWSVVVVSEFCGCGCAAETLHFIINQLKLALTLLLLPSPRPLISLKSRGIGTRSDTRQWFRQASSICKRILLSTNKIKQAASFIDFPSDLCSN